MGLKGVPGIRLAATVASDRGSRKHNETARGEVNDVMAAKRVKHQGPPGVTNSRQLDINESTSNHVGNGAEPSRGGKGGARMRRPMKRGNLH